MLIYLLNVAVALSHGNMDNFLVARMILCGIPLHEPYLNYRLSVMRREEWKSLKMGKLPLSDCYNLMGTADPTGSLEPNEVCIILYVCIILLYFVTPHFSEG